MLVNTLLCSKIELSYLFLDVILLILFLINERNDALNSVILKVFVTCFFMKKIIKYTFITLLILLLLIIAAAYFIANKYEKEITSSVIRELNKQVETEVEVDNISFSLLRNFPKASLEFNNILIHSTKDFLKANPKMDTLIWAKKMYLDFNLIDIYNENYILSQMQLKDGIVKMQMDSKGRDNFHFTKENLDTNSTKFSIDLKKVILNRVSYQFNNWKMGHHIELYAKKFSLNGNLSDDEFGLSTSGSLLMQRITIAKIPYLMYPNTSLNLDLMVNNSKVEVKSGSIKLGDEYLDIRGSYWFDQQSYLDLTARSKQITIKNLIRNLPSDIQKYFDDYDISGRMSFDLFVKGEIAKNKTPNIEISALVDNASLINKKNDIPLKDLTFKAHFLSGNSSLEVNNFKGSLRESFAKGSFSIHNFLQPRIAVDIELESDLKEIKQFFDLDSLSNFRGQVKANLKITGQLADNKKIRKEDIRSFRSSGKINIYNADVEFVDNRKRDFQHLNASLRLDNNNIIIDSLDVRFGHSNAKVVGKAYNTLAYILLDNENLNVNGSLICDSLDMSDIISSTKQEQNDEEKVVIYPTNLAVRLNIDIRKFVYNNFKSSGVFAKFYLNKSHIEISDFRMNTSDGQASGQMNLYPKKDGTYSLEMSSNLSNIDIDQLMYQLDNFGQKSISYKNIDGKLTAVTQLKAHLDSYFNFDKSSLQILSQFNISEGELKNYKPLYSLSKFIKLSDLEDIKFNNFQNTIQIKDSKLYIPKMQIQSNAINLFMSGEHSFANKYSYRVNLLLSEVLGKKARKNNPTNPEFGFVKDDGRGKTSLFLLIKGEGDDMHIKYDTKSVKEQLKKDFRDEKTNLKTILNEEFGLFKKDSAVINNKKKPKEKSTKNNFQIEWDDE